MPRKPQRVEVAVVEEEMPAKNVKRRNGRVATVKHGRSDPDRNCATGSTSSEKTGQAEETAKPVPVAGPDDIGQALQAPSAIEPDAIQIPTSNEIKSELWRIASGNGFEASRVSALRALADIMELLRSAPAELPEAMSAYMDALARGLTRPTKS